MSWWGLRKSWNRKKGAKDFAYRGKGEVQMARV